MEPYSKCKAAAANALRLYEVGEFEKRQPVSRAKFGNYSFGLTELRNKAFAIAACWMMQNADYLTFAPNLIKPGC